MSKGLLTALSVGTSTLTAATAAAIGKRFKHRVIKGARKRTIVAADLSHVVAGIGRLEYFDLVKGPWCCEGAPEPARRIEQSDTRPVRAGLLALIRTALLPKLFRATEIDGKARLQSWGPDHG